MGTPLIGDMAIQSGSETKCRLCGFSRWIPREAESRFLRMPPGTVIRTCTNCGLSVREPLPLGGATATTYDVGYYHEYQMVGRDAPPHLVAAFPLLEETTGPGRLLEIGCGLGAFLSRAQERGWRVQGIELSPWAAAQASLACGAPILVAQGEVLPFPAGAFDAVVSHHVFEHLYNPIQALRESHRVCRPGGRLLLVLPNELRQLFFRWALRNHQGLPRGDGPFANLQRWLAYQTAPPVRESGHLFFFHPQVLRRAAEKTGWRVLRLTTFRTEQDTQSGYPMGGFVKAGLYAIEAWTGRGPEMSLLAEAVGVAS